MFSKYGPEQGTDKFEFLDTIQSQQRKSKQSLLTYF